MKKVLMLLFLGVVSQTAWADMSEEFIDGMNNNSSYVYDPWEPMNRYIYRFNHYADNYVVMPVTRGYKKIVPKFPRTLISNFFSNLDDITVLINTVLQLKPEESIVTGQRVIYNTTFGLAGFLDVATGMGLTKYDEDFGQTLGHYGVGPGPYIVLPILGPSNLRDTAGLGVDFAAEYNINTYGFAQSDNSFYLWALEGIDTRSQITFEYGEMGSPFEYEMLRFFYNELRKNQIAH